MTNRVKIYKCERCGRVCRIRIDIPMYDEYKGEEQYEEFVYYFDPSRSCMFFSTSGSDFKLEMDFEE